MHSPVNQPLNLDQQLIANGLCKKTFSFLINEVKKIKIDGQAQNEIFYAEIFDLTTRIIIKTIAEGDSLPMGTLFIEIE